MSQDERPPAFGEPEYQTYVQDQLSGMLNSVSQALATTIKGQTVAADTRYPDIWYAYMLDQLTELSLSIKLLIEFLAVEAVRGDHLSRKRAGELIGVHQATIARWWKEDSYPSLEELKSRSKNPKVNLELSSALSRSVERLHDELRVNS
jgi:hypothetical protein